MRELLVFGIFLGLLSLFGGLGHFLCSLLQVSDLLELFLGNHHGRALLLWHLDGLVSDSYLLELLHFIGSVVEPIVGLFDPKVDLRRLVLVHGHVSRSLVSHVLRLKHFWLEFGGPCLHETEEDWNAVAELLEELSDTQLLKFGQVLLFGFQFSQALVQLRVKALDLTGIQFSRGGLDLFAQI